MPRYFADQAGSWAVRGGALTQVAQANPGANSWVPNADPITMLGDEAWEDYTVSADATFSSAMPSGNGKGRAGDRSGVAVVAVAAGADGVRSSPSSRRLGRMRRWHCGQAKPPANGSSVDGEVDECGGRVRSVAGTMMSPCDASDPAQVWAWDVPAPGYVANTAAFGGQVCLNIFGCNDDDISFYACVYEGDGWGWLSRLT
jgi:hypothetical protein